MGEASGNEAFSQIQRKNEKGRKGDKRKEGPTFSSIDADGASAAGIANGAPVSDWKAANSAMCSATVFFGAAARAAISFMNACADGRSSLSAHVFSGAASVSVVDGGSGAAGIEEAGMGIDAGAAGIGAAGICIDVDAYGLVICAYLL